eukprot:10579626-Alexandrium_andersonii.AAC.1
MAPSWSPFRPGAPPVSPAAGSSSSSVSGWLSTSWKEECSRPPQSATSPTERGICADRRCST